MDTITGTLRILMAVAILAQTGFGLKCYVCDSHTNDECNRPEDVIDCDKESTPTTKYDTCQTTVKFTPDDGIRILKRCAVAPCALVNSQQTILRLDCDRSTPSWDCEACCNKDRCNVSTAPGTSALLPVRGIILATLMAAILAAIMADLGLVL